MIRKLSLIFGLCQIVLERSYFLWILFCIFSQILNHCIQYMSASRLTVLFSNIQWPLAKLSIKAKTIVLITMFKFVSFVLAEPSHVAQACFTFQGPQTIPGIVESELISIHSLKLCPSYRCF